MIFLGFIPQSYLLGSFEQSLDRQLFVDDYYSKRFIQSHWKTGCLKLAIPEAGKRKLQ